MKAIVLAAGYGTRLRPLTDSLPKPLLPVAGRPVIEHTIMKLKKCKVDGIGVNAHHNAAAIEDYFRRENFVVEIHLSHEKNILGVAGGIGGFREFLEGEDSFIVHNGDVLSDIPIEEMTETYKLERPLCAMRSRSPVWLSTRYTPPQSIPSIRQTDSSR